MNFGIHNASWIYYPNNEPPFEGVKRRAQWAEANGFSWFSVMDHLIQIDLVGGPDQPFMEAWTVTAALAAVTQKIRLCTLVSSVAYRNPALLAKMAATVDVISDGRLTFGIGGGWHADEYRQYGYEFPERPAVRLAQMEEAIRLIKAMWTEPSATFHGNYFHVENAILEPKPTQRPHPPVMIGGSGEQLTLRAVARHGNAGNLFGSPDEIRRKLAVLRQHCDAAGRDYEEIERTNLVTFLIARDESALKAKRIGLKVPDTYRGYAITVAEAIDIAGAYRDAGIQLLIGNFWRNDEESMALLASEVLPKLR